jgi:hypothetical protein
MSCLIWFLLILIVLLGLAVWILWEKDTTKQVVIQDTVVMFPHETKSVRERRCADKMRDNIRPYMKVTPTEKDNVFNVELTILTDE